MIPAANGVKVRLDFGIGRLAEEGGAEILYGLSRLPQFFVDMTALVIGPWMDRPGSDGDGQAI